MSPTAGLTRQANVAALGGAVAIGAGLLAIPVAAVALSGTAIVDAAWTALRLVGLEAFTVIFTNLMTGAFRPLLVKAYPTRPLHRLHAVTGLTGFCLAVVHGILVLTFGTAGYRIVPLWIGPVVLALLALVIATAAARGRLRKAWRWIHRLNYLIFAGMLAHALMLGTDLTNQTLLKVCFGVYAAAVAAGLVYRMGRALKARTR